MAPEKAIEDQYRFTGVRYPADATVDSTFISFRFPNCKTSFAPNRGALEERMGWIGELRRIEGVSPITPISSLRLELRANIAIGIVREVEDQSRILEGIREWSYNDAIALYRSNESSGVRRIPELYS
jgi:hypothetical protein